MRLRSLLAFLILLFVIQGARAYGQVVASWNGGTGNWSDPTNWSPAGVPGNSGGTTYSVTISAPGSDVTMDVLNDGILNLSLGAADSLGINAANHLTVGNSGDSGASVTYGVLNNYGTLTFEGSSLNNYGFLTNHGQMNDAYEPSWNYGTLINATGATVTDFYEAGFHNMSGAYLINSGTIYQDDGEMFNSGTVINNGRLVFPEYSGLYNYGTLLNTSEGTLDFSGGVGGTNFGSLINAGTITNTGSSASFGNTGNLTISNTGVFSTTIGYTQTAGSTLVNGTLTATGSAIVDIQGGTLGGNGTINGNVLMGGTMTPGGILVPGDSPGTLDIFGNYEQTGTGIFDELMGPFSQSLLNMSGDATLDPGATLEITLLYGFNPLGQSFDIMNYGALSGEFVNGSSFWDDNYLWDITYGPNEIDVTAVQAPEPRTFVLLALGLVGLLFMAQRLRSLRNRS